MKRTRSQLGRYKKRKGKRGELDAVKFLRSLGFASARRTVQYRGRADAADVECPDDLPHVFIEVKRGRNVRIGTVALCQAVDTAREQAAAEGKVGIVLHRRNGEPWQLSGRDRRALLATYTMRDDIAMVLRCAEQIGASCVPQPGAFTAAAALREARASCALDGDTHCEEQS
jgi:Holliday junction resolvase